MFSAHLSELLLSSDDFWCPSYVDYLLVVGLHPSLKQHALLNYRWNFTKLHRNDAWIANIPFKVTRLFQFYAEATKRNRYTIKIFYSETTTPRLGSALIKIKCYYSPCVIVAATRIRRKAIFIFNTLDSR